MASELFFYVTIDTFDEIITEFRSCCDGSTEMERELLQQTADMNNLLTEWKSHPGPYKWNYCPPDVSDDMLMKIELGTYLAMKMHLDGRLARIGGWAAVRIGFGDAETIDCETGRTVYATGAE